MAHAPNAHAFVFQEKERKTFHPEREEEYAHICVRFPTGACVRMRSKYVNCPTEKLRNNTQARQLYIHLQHLYIYIHLRTRT